MQQERYLDIVFIMNSSRSNYGKYNEECNNAYTSQTMHKWPIALTDTHDKLNNYNFNLVYFKSPDNPTQSATAEVPRLQHSSFLQKSEDDEEESYTEENNEWSTINQEERFTRVQLLQIWEGRTYITKICLHHQDGRDTHQTHSNEG